MYPLKRTFLTVLLVLGAVGVCLAQDARQQAGMYYVYDATALPEMTPAPEGYTPFYISTFARHGARYCTGEYDNIYGWFSQAAEKNLLTPAGKDFFSRYKKFYNKAKFRKGNLTGIGKAQHKAIAQRMYQRFPAVFEGPTHVEAVSTESARVIMSMWSCLSELQALDKDIDVCADASAQYGSWLQPSITSNPYLNKNAFQISKEAQEAVHAYFEQNVPWQQIAARFFTSKDILGEEFKVQPQKFIDALYAIVCGTYCLDQEQGCFDDVFTAEESKGIWKALSADYFLTMARYEGSGNNRADYAAFTLGQMIEMADKDMASGSAQLRLRFGHDSGIAPLMAILDADGCGRTAKTFDESLEIFPNYKVPMGATVQLVFFKNQENDVLVKVLVNEREVSLPLEAVSGPYYRWADFKAWYLPIVRTAKHDIIYGEDLVTLKNTDWGWQPVPGSKVEIGNATVKVFGSVQNVSLARFLLRFQGISVVESHGPSAAITSKIGKDNKALAAINGSYFNMKTFMPVTYVKDEGKVLCDQTADDETSRCNGMIRIKDKKGRIVDILSVNGQSTGAAAQGWREAMVSGPILLEDGALVAYPDDGSRYYQTFYARRHPRTLIGYTADGWVYFAVIDGRFPGRGEGMSIDELQILCESLGMYEALNLDGGGSSTLWNKESGVVNHPYDNQQFDHEGERTVPNVIIVK